MAYFLWQERCNELLPDLRRWWKWWWRAEQRYGERGRWFWGCDWRWCRFCSLFETSNLLPSIYAIILHNANQIILRHNVTQKMNGIIKIEVITIILTYLWKKFNVMLNKLCQFKDTVIKSLYMKGKICHLWEGIIIK